MKTPRRPPRSRSLPMPLWLQAMIEILLTSIASLVVVLVVLLIGWASLGFVGSPATVLAATGQLWLAGHGVDLHLNIPMTDSAQAVSGVARLTPLGLTLVLLLFARRAGKRLARASYEGQFWQALVGAGLMYMAIGLALSLVTSTSALSTNPLVSAIVPLGVLLVGMFWGGHKVAGSWLRLVGIDPKELSDRYSQYSKWAGAYMVSLIRAAWVGFMGLIATGALLAGVSIFFHWNRMIALYQGLHGGFLGDISVTLLQFALLPNLIVFALAWGSGAGFSVGEGTLVSPATTNAGALPSLPVLGAVPADATAWAYVVLALPVLAGALAGWYFIREGENHLDEWFALKLSWRWLAAVLSGLTLAIGLGILVGLGACLLAAMAHGSLGVGRFTDFGPNPWVTGIWVAVTIAIGAVIGQLVGPWIENDPATDVEPEPRSKPSNKEASSAKTSAKGARRATPATTSSGRSTRATGRTSSRGETSASSTTKGAASQRAGSRSAASEAAGSGARVTGGTKARPMSTESEEAALNGSAADRSATSTRAASTRTASGAGASRAGGARGSGSKTRSSPTPASSAAGSSGHGSTERPTKVTASSRKVAQEPIEADSAAGQTEATTSGTVDGDSALPWAGPGAPEPASEQDRAGQAPEEKDTRTDSGTEESAGTSGASSAPAVGAPRDAQEGRQAPTEPEEAHAVPEKRPVIGRPKRRRR